MTAITCVKCCIYRIGTVTYGRCIRTNICSSRVFANACASDIRVVACSRCTCAIT